MHVTHGETGWIEVVCGPMFSGKSEELIRRLRRAVIARQAVQVFKPKIDDRYAATAIVSHSQLSLEAQVAATADEIAALVLLSGVTPDAPGAGVPTLVVQGDVDGMCAPDAARRYARRTGAHLAMLHGSHFLLLEDEPGVRAAVVAFLRRLH